MKYNKRQEKLQKRIEAWESMPARYMITPTTKERNRNPNGTNVFRRPGSQKK